MLVEAPGVWRFGLLCRAAVQGRAVSGGGACGRMAVQSSLWGQQHACSGLYPPSDTQRGLSPLRLAAAWLAAKKISGGPPALFSYLTQGRRFAYLESSRSSPWQSTMGWPNP